MQCRNCGSYQRLGPCGCTWDEQQEAMKILRRKAAKFRQHIGRPTVVEAERERQGEEARTESRQLAKLPGKKLAHG